VVPGSSSAWPASRRRRHGVVVARKRRAHHEYEPDELRQRLHARLAEVESQEEAPGHPHPRDNRAVSRSGFVRRRQAGVLLVGAIEPEVQPWLRAAWHAITRSTARTEALAALDEDARRPARVDRESGGLDAAGVCRDAARGRPRG
jgi:hypothetical protein